MASWIYGIGASTRRRPPTCALGSEASQRIGIAPRWTSTMPFNRGQVALALFPDSNLRTAKKRPVLVVQADNLGTGLPQNIVAMITSNLARAGHPSRVSVSLATVPGQQSGL